MTAEQPINYPYLAGQLHGALHSLHTKLVAEGLADDALANRLRALQIIQDVLNDAKEAERQYSNR